MANIQDSILKAIDTLVSTRIDSLQLDKTIIATIVQCNNPITNEYKLQYSGGYINALANEGTSYSKNTDVYVLVPENDFSKTKYIIGKTQNLSDDQNISYVSSTLANYNIIGKNVINTRALPDGKEVYPQGLSSYIKDDYILFYDRNYVVNNQRENNLVSIDEDAFANNLKEAEALMIEASFRTNLPTEHRLAASGIYGLDFILAFKDSSTSRTEMDYEQATSDEENNGIKYITYSIDINNMVGNPLMFNSWSDQYGIYPIDVENFLYIQAIYGYCHDFTNIPPQNVEMPATIFIKDLEIYGLKTISEQSDGYTLKLSMPQGNTFKTILSTSTLEVVSHVSKAHTDFTSQVIYYWFVEDNRITALSGPDEYHVYGGAGWRYLKNKGHSYVLKLNGAENRAYENKYKCVAVYRDSLVLKDTFTIYNDACKVNLSIVSTLGYNFSFDLGTPTLTCLVDGQESNFDKLPEDNEEQIEIADSRYRFIWSKTSAMGATQVFNTTLEQLKQEKELAMQTTPISYAVVSAIQNQIVQMEGVEFELGKNKLTYPIKHIAADSIVTFKCSVYRKDVETEEEYLIGTAEQPFLNTNIATPERYTILIENGDQVFQYSESGVSPASQSRKEPIEIKSLKCHFFDNQSGLEIEDTQYAVSWKFPVSDSMIIPPREGIVMNYAEEVENISVSQFFIFNIEESYDYQALNNQVTCIVSYAGQEYTKDTNFLFTKIGENGTNGTDIVAKINPIDINGKGTVDREALTLYCYNNIPYRWNSQETLSTYSPFSNVLNFSLYQRNERILDVQPQRIQWSFAGGTNNKSYPLQVGNTTGEEVGFEYLSDYSANNFFTKYARNQIVKADIKHEDNDYYAFYPIVVVNYLEETQYRVVVDGKETLKYITYNADGRNPLYNKNQGVSITLAPIIGVNEIEPRQIEWHAEGGLLDSEHPRHCAFKLSRTKNAKSEAASFDLYPQEDEQLTKLYIIPDDIYDGAFSNNLVRGVVKYNGIVEAEIYIPIHMSLNIYGLASLNAWDGNHIEINEDENYIMAPQIGAGEKDSNNRFTGVVMGKAETYDAPGNPQIGLLGYSHGEQSIFLDAETGNATFGLSKDQASENNNWVQGRITLRPNDVSSIGSWNIGTKSLFNVNELTDEYYKDGVFQTKVLEPYAGTDYTISIPHDKSGVLLNAEPAYLSIKGKMIENNDKKNQIDFTDANTVIQPRDSFEVQLDPEDNSIFTVYRHTQQPEDGRYDFYEDITYNNRNFGFVIGSAQRDENDKPLIVYAGMRTKPSLPDDFENPYNGTFTWEIFNRPNPTVPNYKGAVVVGLPWNVDGDIFWFTHEVDMSRLSDTPDRLYVIASYEKVTSRRDIYDADSGERIERGNEVEQEYKWRREAKVGISQQGRFYTNALKDSTTALNIGSIGAFGYLAGDERYMGATFEVSDRALIKMFTDIDESGNATTTSPLYISGSSTTNNEYARPMHLYGSKIFLYRSASGIKDTSEQRLALEGNLSEFGVINNDGSGSYMRLGMGTNTSRLQSDTPLTINGEKTIDVISMEDYSQIVGRKYNLTVSDDYFCAIGDKLSITGISDVGQYEVSANETQLLMNNVKASIMLAKVTDRPQVGFDLNSGSASSATTYNGFNFTNTLADINILSTYQDNSNNVGGQIILTSRSRNVQGNSNLETKLTLQSRPDGTGDYFLQNSNTVVRSERVNLGTALGTQYCVTANPIFITPLLHLTNGILGNVEIGFAETGKGTTLNKTIKLYPASDNNIGRIYSGRYSFNQNCAFWCGPNYVESSDLWSLFTGIGGAVGTLQTNVNNTLTSHSTRITNAQSRADSAYSWCEGLNAGKAEKSSFHNAPSAISRSSSIESDVSALFTVVNSITNIMRNV